MDFILFENLLTGFTGFSRFVVDRFPEENVQTRLPSAKPITTAPKHSNQLLPFK